MVKPWMMLVATIIIIAILISYDVKSQFEYEDFNESEMYYEENNDWELFKKTEFALIHRLDLNDKLTYTAAYFGSNLSRDLDVLGRALTSSHEGEIVVLVQSPYDKEIITYMYENGEVVKIK